MADHKSNWDKVKGVIATVAPGLATALGGPLAGQAVAVITNALGLGPNEEEKAIQVLQQSPDALLKLKLAEIEFQRFLVESGIKLEEFDVQDRASARLMAQAKGMGPQIILGAAYTLGYFAMVFGMMSGHLIIPSGAGEQALFAGIVGVMTGAQVQILNFFFGSSSGSQSKDKTIASLSA